MSNRDARPEAQSISAAATETKDSVVEGAKYVRDRVTAPVSGDRRAGEDLKQVTSEKAEEAKQHGKGFVQSIADGAKYVGERLTASPTGETHKESAKAHANNAKSETRSLLGQANDKAKDSINRTEDKLEEEKHRVKDKYNETQQSIADQLATNPVEEARAQGRIPADTETVKAATGK